MAPCQSTTGGRAPLGPLLQVLRVRRRVQIPGREAAFLTNVAEGVAFCVVCRMYSQWVKKRTSNHFKSPMCASLYQPGSTKKGQVPDLNFVLQFPNSVTGEVYRIPTSCPPSLEQGWMNRQIELHHHHARDIQTEEDVRAWHDKTGMDIEDYAKEQKISVDFTRFVPNPELDYMFDNSQWEWPEFKARGEYWGAILPKSALDFPIFNS